MPPPAHRLLINARPGRLQSLTETVEALLKL